MVDEAIRPTGGSVDSEKRQALSNFFPEEIRKCELRAERWANPRRGTAVSPWWGAPSTGGAGLPPRLGPAEECLRRARLAEDRLAEVLAAYRQVRTENEGFRQRITRNM